MAISSTNLIILYYFTISPLTESLFSFEKVRVNHTEIESNLKALFISV
jgi:hypothetical protein